MAAIWTIIGGVGGIARMLVAVALTWLVVTLWVLPAARTEARQGYVLEVRALTAEALIAKLQTEAAAFKTVIDAYQIQYKNALTKQAAQDAETEKAIALNDQKREAAGRKCPALDADDINFLLR